MNISETLDMMSQDIKECEKYLENVPLTATFVYLFSGFKKLIWDINTKRICLNTGNVFRSLIDFPVLERQLAYDHLPNFLKFCREEQTKILDVQSIQVVHKQIISIINN